MGHNDVDAFLKRIKIDLLWYETDLGLGEIGLLVCVDTENFDLPRCFVQETRNDTDECRLASAVGPQKCEEISRRYRERHAFERSSAVAVRLYYVCDV